MWTTDRKWPDLTSGQATSNRARAGPNHVVIEVSNINIRATIQLLNLQHFFHGPNNFKYIFRASWRQNINIKLQIRSNPNSDYPSLFDLTHNGLYLIEEWLECCAPLFCVECCEPKKISEILYWKYIFLNLCLERHCVKYFSMCSQFSFQLLRQFWVK